MIAFALSYKADLFFRAFVGLVNIRICGLDGIFGNQIICAYFEQPFYTTLFAIILDLTN